MINESYQLVLVTWHDAIEMEAGWHDMKEITQQKTATCKTVGWLVDKNDKQIIIMSTIEEDENEIAGGGVHTIPTDWCISIQQLSTYIPPHY